MPAFQFFFFFVYRIVSIKLAASKIVDFVGRANELGLVRDFLGACFDEKGGPSPTDSSEDGRGGEAEKENGEPKRLLVVHGVSGCGKTSFLAKAIQRSCTMASRLAEEGAGEAVKTFVLARFLGTTAGAGNIHHVMRSLCHQLDELFSDKARSADLGSPLLSDSHSDLGRHLHKRLQWAGPSRRVVLFLDSLDQLATETDRTRVLEWFPCQIPQVERGAVVRLLFS